MRVVGGRFKGLALHAPTDNSIRPSSDRLREAVFNVLAHRFDDPANGARVLDLFAGTGALGIEALSRGARSALFIDMSAQSRALVRRNLEAPGIMGLARISKRDATHLGPASGTGGFTLVFLDPPYGKKLADKALAQLARGGWLAANAIIVVEERAGIDIEVPAAFSQLDRRDYGDSQVLFLQFGAN
ncbi:MAG: 16S rRNA (guanine(966)-N(2))-methyltransferase RsmD [Rhodobiaceae bacterium]|nr:16S rRNA (guanine(966)-N(2))-methyltransferase RsmD [Rhodobiaceae bacterium]MCC0054870.1 16S rRNA (guanine(966)-N(2))-methyltransferase RsmD [Rhodobiaceae bacterium]